MTPAETLAKATAAARREGLELAMLQQLRALGLDDGMVRQHRIDAVHHGYVWDFVWPGVDKLTLEVNGGTWLKKSGHSTGKGLDRDAKKQAVAVIHGYRTLIATTTQVRSGVAAQWVMLARGRE